LPVQVNVGDWRKVVDAKPGDLGQPEVGQAEPDDELVAQTDDGSVRAGSDQLPERLLVGEPTSGLRASTLP